jgi:hypothetical protein
MLAVQSRGERQRLLRLFFAVFYQAEQARCRLPEFEDRG